MKNPKFDPRTTDVRDQRKEYDFLGRWARAMLNYGDNVEEKGTSEEYELYQDALIRYYDTLKQLDDRGIPPSVPPFNGFTPVFGKFRDHSYDNYIMGRINKK